jgi:hypothetical protein
MDLRYNIFETKNVPVVRKKDEDEEKKSRKYGKQRVENIIKELHILEQLRDMFSNKEFNDLSLEKVSFKFKNKTLLTIKEPQVLISFINDYKIATRNIQNLPPEPKGKKRSGRDDFSIQFRNKLIISLYNFLVNENICPVASTSQVSKPAIKVISIFLNICGIQIYESYGVPEKKRKPAQRKKRLKVIENTLPIRRKK